MAGVAMTCSSSMLECKGFGAIDSQRCRKLKAMASLPISRVRTGALVGSGMGGPPAFSNGLNSTSFSNSNMITNIGTAFMGPKYSISIARANASSATKQELIKFKRLKMNSTQVRTRALVDSEWEPPPPFQLLAME